jgi:hypothetical protein
MKTSTWFRALAGIFGLFTVGHTLGFLKPPAPESPAAPVYDAMQRVHFPAMGFTRSYLDFYRGFGISVSLEFIVLAVLAWQVASLSIERPREARPFALTLCLGCFGTAAVSFAYFFAAPRVMSLLAAACSAIAWSRLARDARRQTFRRAA